MTRIDPARLARIRAASQLIHRPSGIRDPVDVVRFSGPVQAQEARAARLAFRARARGLSAAGVDRARTGERSLLRAWVMRRTAHLIAAEDAGWMLPMFADRILPWSRRRLAGLGLDRRTQDRALAIIHRAVEREGPLTRPELVQRLESAGIEAAQESRYHLWWLATLDGELCLGPDRGGLTCLVLTRDWIGELERRPRGDSLGELARRYIRAYGPASDRDLARWAGVSLRDARAGLERIAAEVVEVRAGVETLLAPRRGRRRAPAGAVVRLLGAFDNYNLGYASRDFALAASHAQRVAPGGGIIRAVITVDGRVAGTWSSKRSGRRLEIRAEPFAPLNAEVLAAVEAEVADIGRFEGVDASLSG